MKKFYLFLLASVAILAVGCHHEENTITPESGRRAAKVGVVKLNLENKTDGDTPDTKSVVSTDVEGFKNAYMFAFWKDSQTICLDSEGKPMAIKTNTKSFDWALPVGDNQRFDILAIVNPDAATAATLETYMAKTDLTEANLQSINYVCESPEAMLRMEENGMPMSGTMSNIYLESADEPIAFTLRRLYSRYDIKINTTKFKEANWVVNATKINAAHGNTVAPYFYTGNGVGVKATEENLATVDSATSEDLSTVNTIGADNKSTEYVTLYFLENCQGNPTGTASKWNTVGQDLANEVGLCSYIDFSIEATKPNYGDRNFKYRLYLGNNADMKSNFDIIRNKYKKISITLDQPTDDFIWTNSAEIVVAPGESVEIPFETTLIYDKTDKSRNEIHWDVLKDGVQSDAFGDDREPTSVVFYENKNMDPSRDGIRSSNYPHYGVATFTAKSDANVGTISVKGGDATGDVSHKITGSIADKVYYGFTNLYKSFNDYAPGIGDGNVGTWATWFKFIPLTLMLDEEKLLENPVLGTMVGDDPVLFQTIKDFYEFSIEIVTAPDAVGKPRLDVYGLEMLTGPMDDRIWYGIVSGYSDYGNEWNRQPAKCNVYITYTGDTNHHEPFLLFSFFKYVNYQFAFDASWKLTTASYEADVTVTPYAWFIYPPDYFTFDPDGWSDYEGAPNTSAWPEKVSVARLAGTNNKIFDIDGRYSINGYPSPSYTYDLILPAAGQYGLGFDNGEYKVHITKSYSSSVDIVELVAPKYKDRSAPAISVMRWGTPDGDALTYPVQYSIDNELGWPNLVRLFPCGAARNSFNTTGYSDASKILWRNYDPMTQTW